MHNRGNQFGENYNLCLGKVFIKEEVRMEIIVNLLWSMENILFLWGIVQMRFHRNKIRVAIGIIIILMSRVCNVYCANVDFAMILGTIVGPTFGIVLLFEERFFKSIVKYWFAFFYSNFICLPIELLLSGFNFFFNVKLYDYVFDIISILLVIGILYFISVSLKKNKEIVKWIRELPIGYFVIALICAFSVNGLGYYVSRVAEKASMRIRVIVDVMRTILSIFVYMLGIGFALADFLRKQYKNENIIKDQYLRLSKEHYEAMAMHMQEVRKLKHDMQAHINVLNLYAADSKWELLKGYLGDLAERHVVQNYKIISTDNELVDAIISDAAGKNVDNNIIIECEGKFPKDIMVPDFDLCIMFSNLLSNAVEACSKLVNSEKKIHIMIKSTNDELRIAFKNPIEWEVDVEQLGSYTSKKDKTNHGFGVGNIRDTVEKYDGNMVMSAEDGIFETVIVFYKLRGKR